MTNASKVGFLSTLILVFLLPIFFLPTTILPIGNTKVFLLALGVIVAFIAFLVDMMRKGNLTIPNHKLLWATALFPIIYFLSSYFGSDKTRSIFGYNLEVGTFGYILLVSVLFGLVSYTYTSTSKILKALGAFFLSSLLLVLFAIVKLLSGGDFPVWDAFAGNMGNPVGAWTDYSIIFAILSSFSLLALVMLPVKRGARILLGVVLVLSLTLVAVINFSTSWTLLLIVSVIILVYLSTAEKRLLLEEGLGKKITVWPAIVVAAISLLFVINPIVSSTSGTIGNFASNVFDVANVDIRPSLSTTLDISRQVLGERALLGSGPNTFDRDWLLYKPQGVNASDFWNVSFPFGFGFLPTQIASIGLLGSLLWLLFLVLFLWLGVKTLGRLPKEEWKRFALISSFLIAFFIWGASLVYVPSSAVLALAFFFTGLFVASARTSEIIGAREFAFSGKMATNFLAVLLVIVLAVGSAGLALAVYQRTVSAYHFQKAVVLSNTAGVSVDTVEDAAVKAARLMPFDTYYRGISQINVARAQALLNTATGTAEENQQKFQQAISNSIAAARLATDTAPNNYENWIGLGSIYSSLVPSPFSVDGAYEVSQEAFLTAKKLNPTSPEIPLLLARLELDNKNVTGARQYIEESLKLKADYANAYFLLTQLELAENNLSGAIRSAETAAFLTPNNAGVFLQLGLLKYSNSDWNGAASAFRGALTILPEYANAKYYLGLTLSKLKQNEEAVALFQDLKKTNPDNQEIDAILTNLEKGRDPLSNLPGSTSDIRNREELPL